MKLKIRPKKLILPSLNVLAAAGIIVTSVIGSSAAHSQEYNFTAQKWKGTSDGNYSQHGCFFNKEAEFSTSRIRSVKGQFLSALKDAAYATENTDTLLVDAYSAVVGESKVKCDIAGSSNAQITAVGGDFFYFHDFGLVSGSYFTEKDTMQDGAVIDRTLAWELYGSDDVAGMNIYIDGVKCYIAGVVEDPKGKAEKKCAGKMPKAYVSYDTATTMKKYAAAGGAAQAAEEFTEITCYECVLPEPVENFGKTTVKNVFGDTYGENVSIVENTARFKEKTRAKAFKKLSESVIRNDGIRLPYWENASRMAEFKVSVCCGICRYLLIIPIVTFLWLAYKGILAYNKKKKTIRRKALNFIGGKLRKKKAAPENYRKGLTS